MTDYPKIDFARHELKAISGMVKWQLEVNTPKTKRHQVRLKSILRKIEKALENE